MCYSSYRFYCTFQYSSSLIKFHSKFLSLFNYHIFRENLLPFTSILVMSSHNTPAHSFHSRYDHTTVQVNMQLYQYHCSSHLSISFSFTTVVLCAVPGRVCYTRFCWINHFVHYILENEQRVTIQIQRPVGGCSKYFELNKKGFSTWNEFVAFLTHQSSILSMCKYLVIDFIFLIKHDNMHGIFHILKIIHTQLPFHCELWKKLYASHFIRIYMRYACFVCICSFSSNCKPIEK